MKITRLETVLLTGPCTSDPFLSEARHRRSAAFIEIHTDAGIIGLGETYAGYFCPELVPETVRFFEPILVGQNVDNIPELWRRMYHCGNFWCRVGLGTIVLNGIEAALWDLKGKLLGKPVCDLLVARAYRPCGTGETPELQDSLPCYATGGPSNYPEENLARKIEFYLSLGFKAFKIGAGWHGDDWISCDSTQQWVDCEASKIAFVRRRFGNDVGVMLDGHMGNSPVGTWTLDTALPVVKALEPFNLTFFEEPLHYTDPWGYAELCRNTSVPIAGGECLTGTCEWRTFVERDCFDIGQPDASFTGGLDAFMEVADMLQKRDRKLATHAWGAGGSLMQNVHCGFAASNLLILEVAPAFGPLHGRVMKDFAMRDGRVLRPTMPGLGIELTEQIKREFPFQPGSGEYNSVPGKVLPEEQHCEDCR